MDLPCVAGTFGVLGRFLVWRGVIFPPPFIPFLSYTDRLFLLSPRLSWNPPSRSGLIFCYSWKGYLAANQTQACSSPWTCMAIPKSDTEQRSNHLETLDYPIWDTCYLSKWNRARICWCWEKQEGLHSSPSISGLWPFMSYIALCHLTQWQLPSPRDPGVWEALPFPSQCPHCGGSLKWVTP